MPIAELTREIKRINEKRKPEDRIITVLDAVHGFGVEKEKFHELGCDFYITGCHKWLYGPRGTGIVAATKEAWQLVSPVIPSFSDVMDRVIEGKKRPDKMDGKQMTPGGFKAFEHRWAMYEAFEFMMGIGQQHIYERVHKLNKLCKEGLTSLPFVDLHTPLDDDLSSGITCFEMDGYSSEELVEACLKKNLIITSAPYKTSFARMTPGIINTEDEIYAAIDILRNLKK
jgi:isopenicillin-N epimerase